MHESMLRNSFLNEMEWSSEGKGLLWHGLRYQMFRPEPIVAFQRAVEQELGYVRTAELIAAGGRLGGRTSFQAYRDNNGTSLAETLAYMAGVGPCIGWGQFTVIDLTPTVLEIQVDNSPFAWAYAQLYGPQSAGVCHYIRGVWGGVARACLEGEVTEEETVCAATGAPHCRFRFTRI